jgi:hypothetical protein
MPASNTTLPMTANPGVKLANLWMLATRQHTLLKVGELPRRSAAGAGADNWGDRRRAGQADPAGIEPRAMEIVGAVVRLDGANRFDLVNATYGGVYTGHGRRLRWPLTLTAIAKCGWFGC